MQAGPTCWCYIYEIIQFQVLKLYIYAQIKQKQIHTSIYFVRMCCQFYKITSHDKGKFLFFKFPQFLRLGYFPSWKIFQNMFCMYKLSFIKFWATLYTGKVLAQ